MSNSSVSVSLGRWRDALGDLDRGALAAGVIGSVLLLAAFVGFLVGSSFTAVALLGVVLTVVYGWLAHQAETAKALTFLTTISTLLILGLITVYLFYESIPVFQQMGIVEILTRTEQPLWEPARDVFSLAPMIWGTVIVTTIATLVAAPLGIAGALFISEIAPDTVREVTKPAIELLAGIPSIVYGFLGFVVLNTWMMQHFRLPGIGSLFLAGLVVGVMALPTVVSVAEDALASVPESMKSGSLAVGATDWQTMTNITIPAAFSGISAAVILGIGRAVGETMAMTVILGNVTELPEPLYDIFANTITLTSLIASQYGSAAGMHERALFAAGVVLFVIVIALSVVSQTIERRMKQKLGGNE
ncbi:MAG: phosphate ABC transporter permease subunit PstC [Haloferacaceae archaeon]